MLRLHDTATGVVEDLIPKGTRQVGLYVCGPTVYGPPHIGHGRFALVYDVLRRYLEFRDFEVHHVSNITDIDDKIINRANEEGRAWQEIALTCEQEWFSAMHAMGVADPTETPHATAFVPEMIELITELLAKGAAYETSDGVYLAASEIEGYGLLAHQSLASLRAGARVEVAEEKKSPVDFALWKAAKPGEPMWDAPFGPGRPGWHTECVVMSLSLLGEGFDLHGGGQDLMFPHHENERAQAVALGKDFARHWVHSGLVTVSGEKMSKSLNNFVTLEGLMERADPRSYRLLVLQSNYRSPLEVREDLLADAAVAVGRIDALARRFVDAPVELSSEESITELARFCDEMDDDLNTPGAVSGLFDAMRRANSLADQGDYAGGGALARQVLELFAALGLFHLRPEFSIDEQAAELMARRDAARTGRDFAQADALRSELESLGWRVEDGPEGTRLSR